ncbi:MAG: lytic murein transglycosylase B [Betaproteobacteria bacterium]|nr:MAG: lytic murein transglycosylase B [Betaproteobacteria bacterium]TDI81123.1 MAG: lytic murein transglycosylase B [Betaproteobacteria bacterium]
MHLIQKNIINSSYISVLLLANGFFVLFCWNLTVMATQLRPEIDVFIVEMAERHGFAESELKSIFSKARFQPAIISEISRPSTSKPWYEYRPIFVNPRRVADGVTFWNNNARTLERANKTFGVPEEIIIAVIGVETIYGAQTGRHRVLDALTTLAFNYPRRAKFFRGELEQYLLLTREQGTNMFSIKGSYAGAIGIPQFMPSSYRNYAVDFDSDGKIDLLGNAADSIGSVANYLIAHGWEIGGPVATRARISSDSHHKTLVTGYKPLHTVENMRKLGITPLIDVPDERQATLIKLKNDNEMEYWLGFNNFYVITRYNRSVRYAMSVLQLSEKIRAARNTEEAL